MPLGSLHVQITMHFPNIPVNDCLGFDSKFYHEGILKYIFQTTNGRCIGIGKNTTPVAKKTVIESRTVFLVGGLPSVSSVPSLLDRKNTLTIKFRYFY
jgi:hypothetical protein